MIPTTNEDKEEYVRRRFTATCFPIVRKLLMDNGYKRVPAKSSKYRQFSDTTLFDMYKEGDFISIEDYYSITYEKA